MKCEQAHHLFDAYLDGELSPALATELAAHRVKCAECRRELALLEVTGHIIASDDDPVVLNEHFEDRLLACMDERRARWTQRIRHRLFWAGPLAAAALIALAFLGVFDRDPGEVLGEADQPDWAVVDDSGNVPEEADGPSGIVPPDAATLELNRWGSQLQENLEDTRESVEWLKQVDMTILQWLDTLEEAKQTSTEDHFPGAGAKADTPRGETPSGERDYTDEP